MRLCLRGCVSVCVCQCLEAEQPLHLGVDGRGVLAVALRVLFELLHLVFCVCSVSLGGVLEVLLQVLDLLLQHHAEHIQIFHVLVFYLLAQALKLLPLFLF